MKKQSLVLLFGLFVLLLSLACKKDGDKHPEVLTLEIEAVSPTKSVLKGEIVSKGEFTILDHGFIYGISQNLTETSGTKVSLGKEVGEGSFSKEINNPYFSYSPRVLFARSYLTNSNGTVFGQVVSVQTPMFVTSNMSPMSGKTGDLITINGQFYTLAKEEIIVTFGTVPAKITEVTPSKVVVEVPSGGNINNSSSNTVQVMLSVAGQNIYGTSSFKIIPTFKSFSPTSGIAGNSITISGDNIPYSHSNVLKVFFGQIQATISSYGSTNSITAIVPANLTDVTVPISVEHEGVKTTLSGNFTLVSPTVISISPASGLPGSTFSVFGTNFPASYQNTGFTVTIGNIPASISYVSTGQINVTIPNNLPAGDYKVAVKSGPFTVEAPQLLKVQNLAITSFSPSSGVAGKEITLQGTFASGQYHDVYFGSFYTSVYTVSGTTLKVNVPSSATPGNVKISVRRNGQTAETTSDFTILAPSITSFSPASGVAGTVVTIQGTGFGPYSSVRFGTVSANVISTSETSISASVPSGLTPGAMKISVVSNYGQTAVSANNFTFTTN